MNEQHLTIAEMNAYVELAHKMRAEATRDMFRAAGTWIRSLFAGAPRTA